MYELTSSSTIKRLSDNAFIPPDPANSDYQRYLEWLEEGNEPLPYVDPTDYWEVLRTQRNQKLAESDWIVARSYETNTPVPQVWSDYRQALRDLPENTTDPKNPVWPVIPV